MKKRFGDLKKTAIFAAGHLKRPAILATVVLENLVYIQYRLMIKHIGIINWSLNHSNRFWITNGFLFFNDRLILSLLLAIWSALSPFYNHSMTFIHANKMNDFLICFDVAILTGVKVHTVRMRLVENY